MAKGGISVQRDTRQLDRLKVTVPGASRQLVQKAAQDTEAYAKVNMSDSSPSPEGDPPGVITGNLVNSIVAEPEGDDAWATNVYADYGGHLEFGTVKMAARPFLLPAVEAIVEGMPSEIKKVIE